MDESLLHRREFPNCAHDFLRCQIGIFVYERRPLKRDRGVDSCFETLQLFHLLGYGTRWEEAKEMASLHPLLIARQRPQAESSRTGPESMLG